MVKVFGIRHHGPGSARSLLHCLESYHPDCILVEAPIDSEKALEQLKKGGFELPIALLIFNPKDFNQASYFPFAEFSPEWQAIQYGQKRDIPIKFMDLPMSIEFGLSDTTFERLQLKIASETPVPPKPNIIKDPLGYIARLAGYTDSERWWESMFERRQSTGDTFEAILELIGALRHDQPRMESPSTLIREAHMRKILRTMVRKKYQRIAVVCGAWHATALHHWMNFKESFDNQLLQALKTTATQSVWIPWTYDRLAVQSGYAAGVLSPAWYDLLFHRPQEATAHWMVMVAQLLREEGLDVSPAHAMEGLHLANTLAQLRKTCVPGIEEMKEASVAVFCQGDPARLTWIEERLIVGNKMGKIPKGLQPVPLQHDLEKNVKSARLTKEFQSSEKSDKVFDLRKESNLMASRLLHRLNLLDIPWGFPQDHSKGHTGSFRETWRLKWNPDYMLRVIQAGMLGNTIEEAATQKVVRLLQKPIPLNKLAELLGQVLNSGLHEALPSLILQIQQESSLSKDVQVLLELLPPLVQIVRYGNVRKTEIENIEKLCGQVILRASIALPGSSLNLNTEASAVFFEKLHRTNSAVFLFQVDATSKIWLRSFEKIIFLPQASPLIKGFASRVLFDKEAVGLVVMHELMSNALSAGSDPLEAANWLEGFLYGSGLLLVHHAPLWQVVDDWVENMPMAKLKKILPLLRRAFSKFSIIERKKILTRAQQPKILAPAMLVEEEQAEWVTSPVIESTRMLLGI